MRAARLFAVACVVVASTSPAQGYNAREHGAAAISALAASFSTWGQPLEHHPYLFHVVAADYLGFDQGQAMLEVGHRGHCVADAILEAVDALHACSFAAMAAARSEADRLDAAISRANVAHFPFAAPGDVGLWRRASATGALAEYRRWHRTALDHARAGDRASALAAEGRAQHFLQDLLAAGHLVTPRAALRGWWTTETAWAPAAWRQMPARNQAHYLTDLLRAYVKATLVNVVMDKSVAWFWAWRWPDKKTVVAMVPSLVEAAVDDGFGKTGYRDLTVGDFLGLLAHDRGNQRGVCAKDPPGRPARVGRALPPDPACPGGAYRLRGDGHGDDEGTASYELLRELSRVSLDAVEAALPGAAVSMPPADAVALLPMVVDVDPIPWARLSGTPITEVLRDRGVADAIDQFVLVRGASLRAMVCSTPRGWQRDLMFTGFYQPLVETPHRYLDQLMRYDVVARPWRETPLDLCARRRPPLRLLDVLGASAPALDDDGLPPPLAIARALLRFHAAR